jgi:hypothetical protein
MRDGNFELLGLFMNKGQELLLAGRKNERFVAVFDGAAIIWD